MKTKPELYRLTTDFRAERGVVVKRDTVGTLVEFPTDRTVPYGHVMLLIQLAKPIRIVILRPWVEPV